MPLATLALRAPKAARAGVVSGDADAQGNPTGLFRPVDPVNRAEVAKIVAQAVQIYEY